jgi:hypothetical protein
MKPGESVQVVCLGSNIPDIVESVGMKEEYGYKPSTFFKPCRATIWRDNDNDLNIQFKFDFDSEKYNTEFDIEWKQSKNHSSWFPLRNGIYDNTQIPPQSNQVRNWTEFPKSTHVGLLSGPIIRWKHVDIFPLVTFNKDS